MGVLWALAAKGYTIKGLTTGLMEDWSEDKKKEYQRRMNILKTGAFPPEMPSDDFARIVKAVDDHPPAGRTPVYTLADLENNKKAFVVPLLSQKLSAGAGQELPNNDETTALIPVPPHLAKYGKNLAALTVEGDSMYPTLDRGDMVVCDSLGWSGEGVYALRMGGEGFVKRLTKAPGKLIILSDNSKYPPLEEPEGSQDYEIIGRVHCAIKNME
jgi:SOS-response transcriptional repressor LexA